MVDLLSHVAALQGDRQADRSPGCRETDRQKDRQKVFFHEYVHPFIQQAAEMWDVPVQLLSASTEAEMKWIKAELKGAEQ